MFEGFWELNNLSRLGDYLLRVFAAVLAGFAIGYERKTRSKEAGVRTHTLVCMASALMMIISKYGFVDQVVGEGGIRGADGARIAAQIVSGIGFLGAGIIVYRKDTLHGLTTAAGIWATAGTGMAFGAGMYFLGLCSTIIVLLIQILLHLPLKFLHARTMHMVHIIVLMSGSDTLDRLKELFGVDKFLDVRTYKDGESIKADIKMNTSEVLEADTIYKIIAENDYVLSVERLDEV